MLSAEGEIVSWNAGAERIHGYKAQETIGRHFRILYPPSDRELRKPEADLRAAARQERLENEGWRVKNDGSRYWASVVMARVLGESGQLAGYGVITKDLTVRRENELRYRMLVEGIRDYPIFFLDPTAIVTTSTTGAER